MVKNGDDIYILTITDKTTGKFNRTAYNSYEDAFRVMVKDICEQIINGKIKAFPTVTMFTSNVCVPNVVNYEIVCATYSIHLRD